MKVQLLIMLYDSSDLITEVLESYEPYVDRYMLFIDNKTTDNTYQLIKNFKKTTDKKVTVNNFYFDSFTKSRNECLDMSDDPNYDFTIFIDDSFVLSGGEFLRKQLIDVLYDPGVNGIAFKVHRNYTVYNSLRIVRTSAGIRFDGDIHEVFATEQDYLLKGCFINDLTCDNHSKRSIDRVHYDLECLKDKTDARSLYYISTCNIRLYMQGSIGYNVLVLSIFKRLAIKDNDYEERFLCYVNLGNIYLNENLNELAVKSYIKASEEFKPRRGEAYYCAYLIGGLKKHLDLAYKYRELGPCRLPVDYTLYGDNGTIAKDINE